MKSKFRRSIAIFAGIVLVGGAIVLTNHLKKEDTPAPTEKPPVQQIVDSIRQKENERTEPPVTEFQETEPSVEPTEPPVEPTEPPVEPTEPPPIERQEPKAVDFAVYSAQTGQMVHLSDYIGKPIVLNFWASWCGPCRYEMPDFNQMYLQYGDEVQFLMVNLTGYETLTSAMNLIREEGYVFPVFYDFTLEGAQAYGVVSIPTTVFIDAEGYVISQVTGALSAYDLQYFIHLLLGA